MDVMCLKWILIQVMHLLNLFYKGEANTFLFFYFFIFFLYSIVLVLPYINMHPPWVLVTHK